MSGTRAYRKLPVRPRCPSCGKKGLGPIRCTLVHGRGISYRDCRYCGDQFDVPLNDTAKTDREKELAKAIEDCRSAEAVWKAAQNRLYELSTRKS